MYCSRNERSPIASENGRPRKFSVNQLGRGREPVIVVARGLPTVAFSIANWGSFNRQMSMFRLPEKAATLRGKFTSGEVTIEHGDVENGGKRSHDARLR
jgi:hypothetical protein